MSENGETVQGEPRKDDGEAIKSGLRSIADRLEALPERIAQAMASRTAPKQEAGADRSVSASPSPASGDASSDVTEGASPASRLDPSRLRRNTRRAGIGVLSALGSAGVPLVGRLASGMQTADRVSDVFASWFEARDAEQNADLEADVAEAKAARGLSTPPPVSSPSSPEPGSPPRQSPPAPPPRRRSRAAGLGVLHALGSVGVPIISKVASVAEAFDRWQEARRAEGDDEGESPPAPSGVPTPPSPQRPPLSSSATPSAPPPPPRSRPRLSSPPRTHIPTSRSDAAPDEPRTLRERLDRLTSPSPGSEPHIGPIGRDRGVDPGASRRRFEGLSSRPGVHPSGGLLGESAPPPFSGSRPTANGGDSGSDGGTGGDDNKNLLSQILKAILDMKGALEKRPTAQATSATAKPVTGSPVAASVGKAARAASSDRTARGGGAADAASKAEGMVAFARKLGTAAEAAGS